MTISHEYAEELGRQIDELEAENERLRARLSAGTGGLTPDLMNATTVSCTGLDITIACNDHDTKDALMDVLVDAAYMPAQPPAAPVETEASIIAERLRTLAACEDELPHDCAAQWLREAASFIQNTQAAQRLSASREDALEAQGTIEQLEKQLAFERKKSEPNFLHAGSPLWRHIGDRDDDRTGRLPVDNQHDKGLQTWIAQNLNSKLTTSA